MIELIRVSSGEEGTFGVLLKDKLPLCVTLEDPWNNNKNNISCIPDGEYSCIPHNGTKYKETWILEEVPGRSAIVIHVGNTQKNTEGCILVGEKFGVLDGQAAILGSQNAMKILRKTLPTYFTISIRGMVPLKKKLSWWERLLKGE